MLHKLKYRGLEFIVQAFLKDDFINICCISGKDISFKVCFLKKCIISPNGGKETKLYKSFVDSFNYDEFLQTIPSTLYETKKSNRISK